MPATADYLGDFPEDETVHFLWSTYGTAGESITRATDGTVSVYKDNGATQSTAGVTGSEDFDSLTGIHSCTIDTSADAFYTTGANYTVILSAATIDGKAINAVLAQFSIQNRYERGTDSGATATALATAQSDLDILTGADGVTLATAQANYAPSTAAALTAWTGWAGPEIGAQGSDIDTLLVRLSAARAGYLDKLNVAGTLANSDAAATYKADVSALATAANLATVDGIVDSILVDTNELQTNQGNWITATGFSTHSAADVWTAANRALSTPNDYKADVSALATSAEIAALSIPSAADIKTAMEADGSKLDHLWETTEDDAGVRRFTENALEQAPSGTGSTPAQMWAYTTRSLSTPSDYKADVSALATQAEVLKIANISSALNVCASSFTLTTGEEYARTYESTFIFDSKWHEITASSSILAFYDFYVGKYGRASSFNFVGHFETPLGENQVLVYAYNFETQTWYNIGNLYESDTDDARSFPLFSQHTSTADGLGHVRIRFSVSGLAVDPHLYVNQMFVAYVSGELRNDVLAMQGDSYTSATDSLKAISDSVDLVGGSAGSGSDQVTLTISDGTNAIPDCSIWISSDADGDVVVAGTLVTDDNGQATFLLDAGTTYYLWARKSGVVDVQGQSFVAVAD